MNAAQSLADQQAIHTHNSNSFILVLAAIPNEGDPEYSYLEHIQKAYKMLSIYIMHGSDQNYLNTYNATNDAVDAFQAFDRQRLLSKVKIPEAQATVVAVPINGSVEDFNMDQVYFQTELGPISYRALKEYKDNQEVLICSQLSWQDLRALNPDESNTWFYKMLEPLKIDRSPEFDIFDKLPLNEQYLIVLKSYQLSVDINNDKIKLKTNQITDGKFVITKKVVFTEW